MTRDRLTYVQALGVVCRAPGESIGQLRWALRRRHVRLAEIAQWPLVFLATLLCIALLPLTALFLVAADERDVLAEREARERAAKHYGHRRQKRNGQ